jgi:hypothetical protein
MVIKRQKVIQQTLVSCNRKRLKEMAKTLMDRTFNTSAKYAKPTYRMTRNIAERAIDVLMASIITAVG